jgi:hypothetical protein
LRWISVAVLRWCLTAMVLLSRKVGHSRGGCQGRAELRLVGGCHAREKDTMLDADRRYEDVQRGVICTRWCRCCGGEVLVVLLVGCAELSLTGVLLWEVGSVVWADTCCKSRAPPQKTQHISRRIPKLSFPSPHLTSWVQSRNTAV